MDKLKPKKLKLKKSQKFTKFGQLIYLTCSNFANNNLWESSSSCSFGFIFSFVPITVMIITVLIGILKVSPNISNYVIDFANEVEQIVDLKPLINNIMTNKTFHIVDIFLGIWIIWMARKLFLSIIQAMSRIFRSVSKRKNIFNQLLVFICEFIIVLAIAIIILCSFALNQVVNSRTFDTIRELLPSFISQNSHTIVTYVMYFVIFNCTVFVYRFISGVKPPFRLCALYGFLSTICFYVFSFYLTKFVNLTNYNIVYGAISTIVILMMKVYFFFVIFLFFAQMVYVTQFFDSLLQSEIYLLPENTMKNKLTEMRRRLFINPASLKTEKNTHYFKYGETVYTKGSKTDCVYYIRHGSIKETSDSGDTEYTRGNFLGDTTCILNIPRTGTAVASSDCKVIVFTTEEFMDLLEHSPKAASKAISKLSKETKFLFRDEE